MVDEDTHTRNLKLDHSFKIVQVQARVIKQELAKGQEADTEMVDRALETLEITAHNGRDMLAEHVGRKRKTGTRTTTATAKLSKATSCAKAFFIALLRLQVPRGT